MKRSMGKHLVCVCMAVLSFRSIADETPELARNDAVSVQYDLTALWASKYILEGRDNLGEGGLGSVEAVAGYDGFEAGIWYALADTVSYDELNLFVQYGFEVGVVELYAGYTRLEFLKDDAYDNELSAGVAFSYIPWLVPALDYVYATEVQGGDGGSFIEASLTSPVELLEGALVVEPYILEGFDLGYASDHHDGFNHFQFGVCAHCFLNERAQLQGSVNYSIANQDVRQDGGGDQFWFTLGLGATF